MPQRNLFNQQAFTIAGTPIGSVLLGFSIAPAASAQTRPVLNPCPDIYYEEPSNSIYAAPAVQPMPQLKESLGKIKRPVLPFILQSLKTQRTRSPRLLLPMAPLV